MTLLRDSFVRQHADKGSGWVAREIATMELVMAPLSKEELLALLEKRFHVEIEGNRIFSMSPRPDIEDLWHRYGDAHRGYCLEFENAGLFKNGFLVNYGDEFVFDVTSPNAATAHHFYRKTITPNDWSVQQEVRVVTFPRGASAFQAFEPRLLRRIILGRHMPTDVRDRIREIATKRRPAIEIADEPET